MSERIQQYLALLKEYGNGCGLTNEEYNYYCDRFDLLVFRMTPQELTDLDTILKKLENAR